MKIIINKKYRWQVSKGPDMECYFIGSNDVVKRLVSFCQKKPKTQIDEVANLLYYSIGHFAVIIKQENRIIAAVDKVRSYPVFYFHDGQNFAVSNSARTLKTEIDINEIEPLSVLEFCMAGYVTDKETLFKNLYQVQAGEIIIYDGDEKKLERNRYYRFFPKSLKNETENDLIEELDEITNKIFMRVIEDANGAPIWVPLSGGLDSRLVLCKLKQLGYEDVFAFSYGPLFNYEAKWAKYVAGKIKVPWQFIPYKSRAIRKFFFSPVREDYWHFSGEHCTTPFMVDEFAIYTLWRRGILNQDSIIVNGQSGDFITGGHSHGYHLNVLPHEDREGTFDLVKEAILKKHYSLNYSLLSKSNIEKVNDKIDSIFQQFNGKINGSQRIVKYYECWEWQERQSKYVVNGQRSYDFFGIRWALPLWADEYLLFWKEIDFKFTFKQNLYKKYLETFDFFGLFRCFKPVIWNWQGPSMIVFPLGGLLRRLCGKNVSKKFYHYSKYFGKYQNHYAPFGFKRWVFNADKIKSPFVFYIDQWLEENGIKDVIV